MPKKTYVQHITSFIDNMRPHIDGASKPAKKEDEIEGETWELMDSTIGDTTIELGASAKIEGTTIVL